MDKKGSNSEAKRLPYFILGTIRAITTYATGGITMYLRRYRLIAMALIILFSLPLSAQASPLLLPIKIEITTTKKAEVKNALVEVMISKGYAITQDSDFVMAFDKEVKNIILGAMMGGKFPNNRCVFTFISRNQTTLISAMVYMIQNPGTAFEIRESPYEKHEKAASHLLDILLNVKSRIEGISYEELASAHPLLIELKAEENEQINKAKPVYSGFAKIEPDGRIAEIEKGGLAEKAGLIVGDLIIEMNATPLEEVDSTWLSELNERINSGRSVMLVYERDGIKDIITLKKPSK